jgi:preprotein translocase subunit SecG
MQILLIVLHVVACVGLIMIVLLQRGKGAELGAAFGGSSQTVFGSQGAGGFLTRMTTVAAVLFMFTSLGLAYVSSNRVQATVMEGEKEERRQAEAPAAPEGVPGEEEAAPAEQTAVPEADTATPEVPAEEAPQQ